MPPQFAIGDLAMEEKTSNGVTTVAKKPYKLEIVWPNVIGFLLFHIAATYGWYLAFREASLLTWIWSFAVGFFCGIGVGSGAHRYFTHRCYQANLPVKLVLLLAHTIAGQNCMYIWVRDHRQHHKYTDTTADPHNSTRGFFFSHIGWLMCRKHPDVVEKGKTIDMSDLEADQYVMFQKEYYKTLYLIFAIGIPVAVPILCFGQDWQTALFSAYASRSVTLLNITWLVNSAAHLYGFRPFNNKIQPVENKVVAFLSFGEGWHNYHHTFPWDYRAAELGSSFNINGRFINWLASKGWAYNLKKASPGMVEKWARKFGDGSHPMFGSDDIGAMTPTEVEYVPEECEGVDKDAFKNIQIDDFVNEDGSVVNVKESFGGDTHIFSRNVVKVR